MTTHPNGIRADAVTAWMRSRLPELVPPLAFELITGGRSNLTYRIEDSLGRAWALRRPPLHGVLASAHDMGREHKIIAALAPSAVPVPRPVGFCRDPEVTGAPFYVMDFVDGYVIRDAGDARTHLSFDDRRRTSERLVDVLVTLHDLEPAAIGLADLGRPQGYVARQLRRWRSQYEQVAFRDLPLVDSVHASLSARVPPQAEARLVHADYKIDNTVIAGGDIRAVLDWELSTIGEPLADLATLMIYWTDPPGERSPLLAAPTAAEGFLSREDVAKRYAEKSGRDVSDLAFFVSFAYWRLAIILEGVYARYASGAQGDAADDSYLAFADEAVFLLQRAADAVVEARR